MSLNGCTFAFTGVLKNMTRADAGVDILAAGGQVSESVSKKTDYLVVGENPGGKLDKAVKLGVRVIDESVFKSMLEKDV